MIWFRAKRGVVQAADYSGVVYADDATAMSFAETCRQIELILSDVDGVMTDGGIQLLDDGQQMMKFHIRDGMGVRLWREAGKRFGIVTGRNLEAVRRRADDLWLDIVKRGHRRQAAGGRRDRRRVGHAAASRFATSATICSDLRVIQAVGLGVAVADAVEDVRHAAKYVTSVPRRRGAGPRSD